MSSDSHQTVHGSTPPPLAIAPGGAGGPGNIPRAPMPGRDASQKGSAITKARAAFDEIARGLGKSPVQLLESDFIERVLASYKAEGIA